MAILRQGLATLIVVAVGLAVWIAFVPSARPFLDRIGLLEPFGLEVADETTQQRAGGFNPGGSGPVTVVAQPAFEGAINDEVTAIGDGRALRSVTLVPEVTGYLAELRMRPGAYVEAGSVVATLEDQAERIRLDRALLMLEDARATAARLERLGSSGAVTDLQRQDAALALQTAELTLREAEFELARRSITAPISGWVGLLPAEVGDQVSAATPIAQIDDRSRLVLEFRVPERFVGMIREGDEISVSSLARRQESVIGEIIALDNRVDQTSRTLRVQAALDNPDDTLRPGMAFRITARFAGDIYPAVDPLAIQWSAEGAFVWVVREDRAERVAVTIMQRSAEAVLVSGELSVGDLVVTEGVQNLRPGAEVSVELQSDLGARHEAGQRAIPG
jgi:RND family efflux transporter MFP subunit